MKRFLLFAYETYHAGGWNDYIGEYDTAEAANEYGLKLLEVEWCEYYHVVDTETIQKVYGKDFEGYVEDE